MIAILWKRNHAFPYVLSWVTRNGIPLYDTYKTKKDATEYARAMGFIIKDET